MSRRDTQREVAANRLKRHLLDTGLSETSLRQLAAAAGVSDRMLLYYFSDKSDALNSALQLIADDLTQMLDVAVPPGTRQSFSALISTVSTLIFSPETKPYFRLWTEVIAGVIREPEQFEPTAKAVSSGFLIWIEERLDGGTPKSRKADAATVLAMIDGLVLLEICTDERTAKQAATRMGTLEYS